MKEESRQANIGLSVLAVVVVGLVFLGTGKGDSIEVAPLSHNDFLGDSVSSLSLESSSSSPSVGWSLNHH